MMKSDAADTKARGEKLYPVLCAWCEKKGKRTVIRWVDYPNSHGICDSCADDLRREVANYRSHVASYTEAASL